MDNIVYWIARGAIAAVRLLPLETGFVLGQALGALLWLILPGYRRLARENIAAAFHGEKSPAEIRALTFSHFVNLGANSLSALKLASMPEDAVRKRVIEEGVEQIKAEIARQKGVVMAINHIGNWELFAQLLCVIRPTPAGAVYQPLRNKAVNRLIDEDRRRRGVETFDRSKGFAGAIALLRRGGLVGVLVDQSAGKGGIWMPFFNRLCSTSPLAASLAVRTGAAVVPVAIYTIGIARWRACVSAPIPWSNQDSDRLTFDINLALERQIRVSPSDWFWVHNRWKTPHPDVCVTQSKRGVYLPADYDSARLRPYRILVRSSNWLGDAVMGIPAVRALKHGRPDAHVTILTRDKLADLWRAVPEVDEVIPIKPAESVFATADKIRGGFDVAVLLPNSFRTALEVRLAGIPRRIGYRGHRRSMLLDQIPDETRKRFQAPHQAERYLNLVRWLGAEDAAGDPLGKWTPSGKGRIGICPGAEYGAAKQWLPDRFAGVVKKLDQTTPRTWVLVGVPKDAAVAGEIVRLAPDARFENLVGKTSLASLIALLRNLDGLITNDTGTMHLAAMIGVPTVAIFGSTDPVRTGPVGPRAEFLYHKVECSPCFLRECPIDFRCMKAITAEEAATALERIMGESRAGAV